MKITIIGAGFCGLYLGWKLGKMGHSVSILERGSQVGQKACSGLISKKILQFFPQAANLAENKINSTVIHFPKKTIHLEFYEENRFFSQNKLKEEFFVIERKKLDNLLARLAKENNVKIIFNQNVKKIPEDSDCVIACDGALSQIRKKLNLKNPEFFLGIQGFLDINQNSVSKDNLSFAETWATKNGFIWKILRGNPANKAEYGIMEKPEKAKAIFDDFLIKQKIKLNDLQSAIIPQGLIFSRDPRIILMGDAMGLTKPWSGGGIIWDIFASEILLKNFPDLIKAQKEIKKFFLPKIIFSQWIKKIIYFLGYHFPFILPDKLKIDSDFLFK